MIKQLLLVTVCLLLGFSPVEAKQLIPMGSSVGVKLELPYSVVGEDVQIDEEQKNLKRHLNKRN